MKTFETIRNQQAILLIDKQLFFRAGDLITVLSYHEACGCYEIKNSYGGTTYVYREDFQLVS